MDTICLNNEFFTLKISAFGAEIISAYSKCWNQELIWQADPKVWARHAPVLFPFVGKLKQDNYKFQGEIFKMSQHGFARDRRFTLEDYNDMEAIFLLRSDEESLKLYPFAFELKIKYSLTGKKVNCEYNVYNRGSTELYFSIGAHPGFIFPFASNSACDENFILFSNEEYNSRFLLNEGLFNGNTAPVFQSDNRTLILNEKLLSSDAVVLKNLRSSHLILSDQKNELRFSWENFSYFGIWTKNIESGFICLEPWSGLADSIYSDQNLENKEGIRRLASGGMDSFVYSFETIN
jgi:galactose mutarotase-like enzyme